jgi:hypothetical protein
MGGVQELCQFLPVHVAVESDSEPSSVAVMGRRCESRVVRERVALGGIAEEVK